MHASTGTGQTDSTWNALVQGASFTSLDFDPTSTLPTEGSLL